MAIESFIDFNDVEEPLRSAILECEVTANRAVIRRGERPIAILTSWDEYLSLSETAALTADEARIARVRAAERDVQTGGLLTEERLEGVAVAIARSSGWEALSPEAREEAAAVAASLVEDPIAGAPLLSPLRGLWVLRRGPLRLVYLVAREAQGIGIVAAEQVEDEA